MSTPDLTSGATVTDRPKRGRKAGSRARERAQLPPEAFVIEEIPEERRGENRRVRVERDDQQQKIDAKVFQVWQSWVAAGMPRKWDDMPVVSWVIPTKFAEDALFYLHKAANFHGKKLVTGNIQPVKDKPGSTRIPFCVITRTKKEAQQAAADNSAS